MLRVAIVGPTHPIKGGVAQHTTVLAARMAAAGYDVRLVSWYRQYPQRLYPGRQTVQEPEFAPFEPTSRVLAWDRPDTWIRAARRLRDLDLVVFAHITPFQAVPYRLMLAALRSGPATTAIIAHNVLPHERRPLDERLVGSLLRAGDRVIVHSEAQAAVARALTGRPVAVLPMAPFMPDAFGPAVPGRGEHRRLLFFGLVRPYKGLDVLLRALAMGPGDVRLRVAGEFWGGTGDTLRLGLELGVADRVELVPGYLAASEVPRLFHDVDALVLPYRSATGSQGVWTGFQFGVPVIATRTGSLADEIRDGVDGIIAEPDDVDSLASAIVALYRPGVLERMRANVHPVDPDALWRRYIAGLTGPLSAPGAGEPFPTEGKRMRKAAPPGGILLKAAKVGAEQVLWARAAAKRHWQVRRGTARPIPSPVPPTDVLSTADQVDAAVRECRRLGLPLHHDRPKNWDALGAVSTVLNVLGRDIRVLDAGAARYSPILPWLRLYDVRELIGNNLEFSRVVHHGPVRFEPGDITATSYPDGSFDAVTCMSVIEHGVPVEAFMVEMGRIVRPGGLLVLSTDYDHEPIDTAGKTAYGSPVKIFDPVTIQELIDVAAHHGLDLVGDLRLDHAERAVHWRRTGLDYTFIRLTFSRSH